MLETLSKKYISAKAKSSCFANLKFHNLQVLANLLEVAPRRTWCPPNCFYKYDPQKYPNTTIKRNVTHKNAQIQLSKDIWPKGMPKYKYPKKCDPQKMPKYKYPKKYDQENLLQNSLMKKWWYGSNLLMGNLEVWQRVGLRLRSNGFHPFSNLNISNATHIV